MEPAVLKRARHQLALRLALFTTGVIIIFALQTNNQLQANAKQERERKLQLLALIASNRLQSDSSNTISGPSKHFSPTPGSHFQQAGEDIRILWIDSGLNLLEAYGSFVPGGKLIPAENQRLKSHFINLSNGQGIWFPVIDSAQRNQGESTNGQNHVRGYVAIASSEAPSDRSAVISLISATAASVILATLGIPWILERSLQPLREQLNRLSQFAGDVAHELRNPMMALKTGLANAREALPPEMSSSSTNPLEQLKTITSQMACILDDILLLTKIENGIHFPEEAIIAVDVAEIFDELSILHDSEARDKKIDLIFQISAPITLTIAPARAQRILSNLITNAIRFSNIGSQVLVSASVDQARVVISVDDAGPGIPSSEQERVFERFVQLNGQQEHAHSGIGLALSRSLAQLHDGSLVAQQSPTGGCRMVLKLPQQSTGRRRQTPQTQAPA